MTRTKRLITVGLASAAVAAATLLTAEPARADYNEAACRAALADFNWWTTISELHDTFLIPTPWAVSRLVSLAATDVMSFC
jgi:hypothetical protein